MVSFSCYPWVTPLYCMSIAEVAHSTMNPNGSRGSAMPPEPIKVYKKI